MGHRNCKFTQPLRVANKRKQYNIHVKHVNHSGGPHSTMSAWERAVKHSNCLLTVRKQSVYEACVGHLGDVIK
jgi:hypothetical protein